MADPTRIDDHLSIGLSNLLTQFRGQPNIQGILRSYLTQLQEIEDVAMSLIDERYVDTATGVQLDGIGTIVGEPRAGRSDVDYRVAIKGRIRANAANSRIEDILELFVLLLPGFTFTLSEGTEANFTLVVDQALAPVVDSSPGVLDAQLQIAKGGGVRASLVYGTFDSSLRFTYAPGDVLIASTTQGYADDTPTTFGGHYADVAD